MTRTTLLLVMAAVALPGFADELDTANTVEFSKTFEIRLEHEAGGCQATATVEYLQRGAEAEVDTLVENAECGASSGEYAVELTVRRDGTTEAEKLRFEESWSRDDKLPVKTSRRYTIGDNADLLRVKVRDLSCTCATTDEDTQ